MIDPERLAFRMAWPIERHARFAERLCPDRDVVLMYHAVGRGWGAPHSIPIKRFREQIAALSAHREVVPLRELGNDRNESHIAVTFDDGYRDFHDTVVPILSEYEVPATVFVSPAFLGDENRVLAEKRHERLTDISLSERIFMTASELESVAAIELVSVGNHTLDHPDLSAVDTEEARRQIAMGRRQLEAVIDDPVDLFSYPYGSYSSQTFDRLRPVVAESHDVAVTAVPGHVGRPHDPLRTNRTEAPLKMESFEYRISKLYGTLAYWYAKYVSGRG